MEFEEMAKHMLGGDWFKTRQVLRDVAVSTGIPRLDFFLGGGLPSGPVEIYGEDSVGKTLVLGHILAQAQREGKRAALCATEYLDLPYLERIGVDLGSLLIIRGGPVSALLDVILSAYSWGNSVVAIDSASGLTSSSGEYSDWFDSVNYLMTMHEPMDDSCMVMASQVRQRKSVEIGKMFRPGTDSATKKFSSDFRTRLELVRSEVREEEYTLSIIIQEHSLTPPGRILDFNVTKGEPISVGKDIFDFAIQSGVIEQRASTYRVDGDTLGVGRDACAKRLGDDKELGLKVLDKSLRAWGT
jgi:recombination protein RecA